MEDRYLVQIHVDEHAIEEYQRLNRNPDAPEAIVQVNCILVAIGRVINTILGGYARCRVIAHASEIYIHDLQIDQVEQLEQLLGHDQVNGLQIINKPRMPSQLNTTVNLSDIPIAKHFGIEIPERAVST